MKERRTGISIRAVNGSQSKILVVRKFKVDCQTIEIFAFMQFCSGAEIASKAEFLVWTEALSGTLPAKLRFTIRYSVNTTSVQNCFQS